MGMPVPAGQAGRQGPVASGADDLHPNGTDTIDLVHRLRVTALTWGAVDRAVPGPRLPSARPRLARP